MHVFPSTRRLLAAILAVVLVLVTSSPVHGQIRVEGGPVELVPGSAAAGQDPAPAVNDAARLRYRLGSFGTRKVIVSTTCPGQQFDLSVQARNVSRGTTQGAISLTDGMVSQDLIRDITLPNIFCLFLNCEGTATLQYRSVVRAEDGAGADDHILRYTILAQ